MYIESWEIFEDRRNLIIERLLSAQSAVEMPDDAPAADIEAADDDNEASEQADYMIQVSVVTDNDLLDDDDDDNNNNLYGQ